LKEELYAAPSTDGSKVRNDALQALLALGYQRNAAEKAIRDVVRDQPEMATNVAKLIKAALKEATNS
jgi:Holliday junction resolvasome RuvABC DNA-binding subunit